MCRTYIIDGSKIFNYEDFCREFSAVVLSGKHHWHGNLDAFNDILSGGFVNTEVDETFTIIWKNSNMLRESLGYIATIKLLEERLLKCHPTNVPHVTQELQLAKKSEGPTVFDWLKEIISNHKHITLALN